MLSAQGVFWFEQVVEARERNASLTKDVQILEHKERCLLKKVEDKVLQSATTSVHAMALFEAQPAWTGHDLTQVLTVCGG